MSPAPATVVFAVAAAVLTWGGVQPADARDAIAERAGLSRSFVGMLLVVAATSMPELVTDVSAAVAVLRPAVPS